MNTWNVLLSNICPHIILNSSSWTEDKSWNWILSHCYTLPYRGGLCPSNIIGWYWLNHCWTKTFPIMLKYISVVWLPQYKLCLVWDLMTMCKLSQDIISVYHIYFSEQFNFNMSRISWVSRVFFFLVVWIWLKEIITIYFFINIT